MSISVDIEKKLGSFHLRVAFEAENETMALLGASGCGKSMTLRCIAGIVRPDRGRIVLNGRTLFDSEQHIDLPPQQRGVGYLFQQYALFPHMTVEKNVCAGTREGTRAERKAAAQRILRTLGLEELAQRLPANLSGGQQQRVALARILVGKPEILLLDEPFSALDEHIKWKIELELADTLRSFPGGVLFVSHSRDEIFQRPEAGDKGAVIVLLRDQLQPGGVIDGKVPNESFLFGGKADGQNACFLINFIPGVGRRFFPGASVSFSFTGVLSTAPGQHPYYASERQDQGKYLFCVVFFFLTHIMSPRFYMAIHQGIQ